MSSTQKAKHDLRAGLSAAKLKLLEKVIAKLKTCSIKFGGCLVMTGAGVSTSAGIPDFRSKDGLYSRLGEFELKKPEDIFTLSFFEKDPRPYYKLAKELDCSKYQPTLTHWFIRKMEEESILRRLYTQNIDGLEFKTGMSHRSVVQAHGGFRSAHCINGHNATIDSVQEHVNTSTPCYCQTCGAPVKHDVVFFGENLPSRFLSNHITDFQRCDMLFVIGTSLHVSPFNTLQRRISFVPRILINREVVGEDGLNAFKFDDDDSEDLFLQGDCDAVISAIAEEVGWTLPA
jgi:NAD-dependent deacetylase sirtuin 2